MRGFSLLFVLCGTAALAQQTSIHDEILRVYNFEPKFFNEQQINEKSIVLDQYWEKAKSQRSQYLPALRQELANFSNPPFFLYDGSMLLLNMSDTSADRKVALAAMARCDLRDLKPTEYFTQVQRLAALNEDTTAAAFHILEEPNFQAFIPQHVLTLGQDFALVYMLLPTDQSYWLSSVIARLGSERDPTAMRSLLLVLWYAQTDGADQATRSFAADSGKPSAARSFAEELLRRQVTLSILERVMATFVPEASIRQWRRDRMKPVSDEALYDLDSYTRILIRKRR